MLFKAKGSEIEKKKQVSVPTITQHNKAVQCRKYLESKTWIEAF